MFESEWPSFIPDHAQNVLNLAGGLWLWEFAGGAVVYLGAEGMGPFLLQGSGLHALVLHLVAHSGRYHSAIAAEEARQEAYDAYISGVAYEPDDGEL